MKKAIFGMALMASGAAATLAHAQGSVTLWGIMDTGVTYVSNQSGKHEVKMDDGVYGPDLWGIRGSEELGGGTKAVFELVDQYSVDNGAFTAQQSLFSRNALVGLENNRFGKLTFGNQYDFMVDSLFFSSDDPVQLAGQFYGFRAGPFQKLNLPNNPTGAFDWDHMSGGEAINNSVKYLSPTFAGFSAGAMYAFGNVAGSVGAGSSQSFGLNYQAASFGANAAYTNEKTYVVGAPQVSVRNWGVGAHYDFGHWKTDALVTTVHNSANHGCVYEISAGALYNFTSALSVGASYMYMKGNAAVDHNHAHQVSALVNYALSKRTSIYLMGLYQRANAGAQAQLVGENTSDGASSTGSQTVVRIGLHTAF